RKCFASATPELFEKHLLWLREHCELIRMCEALQVARNVDASGSPRVAITFDDGYADNYEYAFPLLYKYEIPATFFLTAGLVNRDPAVVERFQRLRRAPYDDIRPLTWTQVREMCQGGMDIGSHTYSHPNLARLDGVNAREELQRSKAIIEESIGQAVTAVAYPFGKPRRHFTAVTMKIAADLGYQNGAAVAFRAVKAQDNPLALPRFFVTRDDLPTLQAKINGAWDILGLWQEKAPLWLARLVSPADFRV
ncbi:MAG: polysaccharide deacetylase family protein, partial [Candidatus Methanomethyliaceae archaeon]